MEIQPSFARVSVVKRESLYLQEKSYRKFCFVFIFCLNSQLTAIKRNDKEFRMNVLVSKKVLLKSIFLWLLMCVFIDILFTNVHRTSLSIGKINEFIIQIYAYRWCDNGILIERILLPPPPNYTLQQTRILTLLAPIFLFRSSLAPVTPKHNSQIRTVMFKQNKKILNIFSIELNA